MRFTVEHIESVRQQIDAEFDRFAAEHGVDAATLLCLRRVTHSGSLDAENDMIKRFCLIIWTFKNCRNPALLPIKTFEELSKMADFTLRLMGIKPYVSQLSYLFGILYRARAEVLTSSDEAWLAAWNLQLADAMDGRSNSASDTTTLFDEQLRIAECNYQAGLVHESLDAYQKAEDLAKCDDEIAKSRLGLIRSLRVLNQIGTAWNIASSMKSLFQLSPELTDKLEWELELMTSQEHGDISNLRQILISIKSRKRETDPSNLILACLWCYASKQRGVISDLPRSGWIKRRFPAIKQDQRLNEALRLLTTLEDCYATGPESSRTDIFIKLKAVGDFLGDLRKAEPSEHSIVFLAAIARWLIRVKQKDGAALVINEYKRRSHQMSQSRHAALYGLLDDLLTPSYGEVASIRDRLDIRLASKAAAAISVHALE